MPRALTATPPQPFLGLMVQHTPTASAPGLGASTPGFGGQGAMVQGCPPPPAIHPGTRASVSTHAINLGLGFIGARLIISPERRQRGGRAGQSLPNNADANRNTRPLAAAHKGHFCPKQLFFFPPSFFFFFFHSSRDGFSFEGVGDELTLVTFCARVGLEGGMHFADGIWGDGLQWNAWGGLMRISWGWEDLGDARHAPSTLEHQDSQQCLLPGPSTIDTDIELLQAWPLERWLHPTVLMRDLLVSGPLVWVLPFAQGNWVGRPQNCCRQSLVFGWMLHPRTNPL